MLREDHVYRLMAPDDWVRARVGAIIPWTPNDTASGFFHLSTAAQVPATAARHHASAAQLVAIGFSAQALGPQLRFEPSRGGDLFPHYYGWLPASLAKDEVPLMQDPAGLFRVVTA